MTSLDTAPAPSHVTPLPTLPSGEFKPVEHEQLVPAQVISAEQTGDVQTFLLNVPYSSLPIDDARHAVVAVRDEDQLLSVVGGTKPAGVVEIWVRKRASQVAPTSGPSGLGDPAVGPIPMVLDVYTDARLRDVSNEPQRGQHYQLSVELTRALKPDPKLVGRYLEAVSGAAPSESPIPWLLEAQPNIGRPTPGMDLGAEWTHLMRLSSGYESIESALATNPLLRDAVAPQTATIALKNLKAPALRRHDWPAMLKAVPATGDTEPLAELVPADFYFVRARSFDAFQSLLSHADELITPVLGLTTKRREILELEERYRLELGLPADELTRVLGPELIGALVLVGSDPLLRQGSDLSLLMAVPNTTAVLAAMALRRAEVESQLPLVATSWTHQGIEVKAFTSAQGELRQHVATYTAADGQQYVLVSNSPNAVKRIVDVWAGKAGKLSDELDFQYMLRRDPHSQHDVLGYMSDKFVAEVVSPRQRVLEVRRQVAKSELATMGYGALLYAQVQGTLPSDAANLTRAKWLSAVRAKHTSGETISYLPTRGPWSSWGTAARLTSIIDLPTPQRVSKTEQQAYESFVASYEQRWGENIDPIAIRVTTTATVVDAHVRVLPVVNSNDYSEIASFSGGGSTTRKSSLKALAAILAIGEQSQLRQLLSRQGESFLGRHLKLDWLGQWLEIGLADHALLAQTALEHGDLPRPPDATTQIVGSDFTVLSKLPLYLILDIKSAAGAALLLTTLRELATEAAPEVVRWQELKTSKEHKVVQVSFDDVDLYYNLSKNRFVLSPDLLTLERLLDLEQGQTEPAAQTPPSEQSGGQLVVELAPRAKESALRSVAAWLAELGIREAGIYNPLADLLLRAVPALNKDGEGYRRVSLAHLGGVPVTAEGLPYERSSSGLIDGARGTRHAPRWPNVPVQGGAVEHILRILSRLRTEVSIDPEPGSPEVTSLRTRLLLERQERTGR